jgi:glycosyltransferase involved in cell wall biosynthesis
MREHSPVLSICVPTYNRAHLLAEFLKSSLDGPLGDMEVLIVDDGSADGTEDVVKSFAKSFQLRIRYVWQPNQGRSVALHNAISLAEGRYVLLMDSDDYFSSGALKWITEKLQWLSAQPSAGVTRRIVGICGLAYYEDGRVVGSPFPQPEMRSNLVKMRADLGVTGDKKEIIERAVLLSVRYEPIPGERRMPTGVLWARVALKGDCLFFNRPLIVKRYQTGGMTRRLRQIRMESPVGSALVYLELLALPKEIFSSPLFRMRAAVNAWRYWLHASRTCRPRLRIDSAYMSFLGFLGGVTAFVLDHLMSAIGCLVRK